MTEQIGENDRPVSAISGASSGFGAIYARRFAEKGHDLFLVARRQDRLDELAASLREKYNVRVETMRADLSKPDELLAVEKRVESLKNLEYMVNSAGFGGNRQFPDVDLDHPHFDLRFGCRKVGMCGGLKQVERDIGIVRSENIAEVDGFEAVRLWKRWTSSGDRSARDRLVEYNIADTVNLRELADIAYRRLVTDYAGFE